MSVTEAGSVYVVLQGGEVAREKNGHAMPCHAMPCHATMRLHMAYIPSYMPS